MTRNPKVLGTVLVAVFAVFAAFSAVAQAEPTLTAEAETTILTGEPIEHNGTFNHVFTIGKQNLVCVTVKWIEKRFSVDRKSRQTMTPTYKNCTYMGLPATVTMNGCDYELQNLRMSLVCEEPKKPEVHVYANATEHANNKPLCTYKYNPFKDQTEAVYENGGGSPADVRLTINHVEFTAKREGSILCGAAEPVVSYTGALTIKAYQELESETEGSQVGLSVSPE